MIKLTFNKHKIFFVVNMSKNIQIKENQILRKPTRAEAEEAVKTLISWAGDNPHREGLMETPKRVVKSYEEFFAGYIFIFDIILSTGFCNSNGFFIGIH